MSTQPLLYKIPLLSAAGSSSFDWKEAPPVKLGHYLWMDNGYTPEVHAAMYGTTERLFVRFTVQEANPTVRWKQLNDPVYKDSCVEFFMQPCPDTDPRYLNFELNAAGVLLLKLGVGREDRQFLTCDEPDLFRIRTSAVQASADGPSPRWELEFSIPVRWLQELFPDFRPASGTRFRGNFYKCGDETPLPHYGCWNRITSPVPDFHRSCDFGLLELV